VTAPRPNRRRRPAPPALAQADPPHPAFMPTLMQVLAT